ncbi:MAG: methyltransferase domain-containing protein, partial [Thiolinea sp.]
STMDARESIPQIEVAVGDNATALIFRHMEPLSAGDSEKLLHFAREFGYQLYLQPGGPETVHGVWPEHPELYYEHPQFNTRVDFGPLDFIQVNQPLNRKMVALALELLAPAADETVLDLFCGLGNFTLPLARKAGQVVGVEGDAVMVRRAQAAALANGIENTRYHACNLMDEAALPREAWLKQTYDKILLDPPAGAKEVIACSASCKPNALSMSPAIRARWLAMPVSWYTRRATG